MISSLSSALSGIRVNQTRLDVSAHDVANVNTEGFKAQRVEQVFQKNNGVDIVSISNESHHHNDLSDTDLATERVEQISSKSAYTANAHLVKVQEEMIGEVIDILAR